MARLNTRRQRDSDDESADVSREGTPTSTAPEDRKRMRRSAVHEDEDEDEIDEEAEHEAGGSQDRQRSRQDGRHVSNAPIPRLSAPNGEKKYNPNRPRHQPGAIVRVKLTNFVTYTAAEFFPGPNLNMVIGPNGTGKSTLVCAICLGLGWGPSLLGRAKEPQEFIKHGASSATIEIELQRATSGPTKTNRNPVITRIIRHEGSKKSEFFVNDKNAAQKAVLEMAKKYNIQCDNLCQFLPQDRVVEFAQMNPVQMLQSTMEAAAGPEIVQYHSQLKAIREEQRELMASNQGDRDQLENLEKRQQSQKADVEKLRERMVVLQQIEWLEKCRPISLYASAKKQAHEDKRARDQLGKDVAALEKESAPTLRRVDLKKQYFQSAKKNREDAEKETKRGELELQRLEKEISNLEDRIKEKAAQAEAEKKSIRAKKDLVNRAAIMIRDLQAQRQNEPEPFDSREMQEKIQDKVMKKRTLEGERDRVRAKAEEYQRTFITRNSRRKELKETVEKLESRAGQQEDKLRNLSSDSYQAWEWIKNNQDKFQMPVFGPPAVEVTLTHPSKADAIEALLQQGDFRIFTVQCKADFHVLQRELIHNKRLHDIAVRVCPNNDVTSYKSPVSQDELQRYGLEKWAIDYLSGPGNVLSMLCQERSLHRAAIARGDVTPEQHQAITNSQVASYVAGRTVTRFTRRAEYGAAGISAKVNELRQARIWTNRPVESGRKAELQAEIEEINVSIADTKESFDAAKADLEKVRIQLREVEEETEALRSEKDAKQKALMDWKGLDTKITQAQESIDQAKSFMDDVRRRCVDLAREQDGIMFQKAESVLKFSGAAHALRQMNARLLEAEMILIEAQSDSETLSAMSEQLTMALAEKQEEHRIAVARFAETSKKAKGYAEEAKAVSREAQALNDDADNPAFMDLIQELISKGDELTVAELDDRLEIEQSKLRFTEGGNANVMQEFEDRAKKIEKLQDKLSSFREQQDGYLNAIKEVREAFETGLQPIIEQINDAFSDSFARIGCAGEIKLHKASSQDPSDCTEEMGGVENGLDFANWAIHIHVKFRENEPLSLLDSHRQSGGERAVSTIFYLMALQTLSRSPFRVVDEINQGMDPRNERMVHGRMVDIAAADENGESQGSQYFLITPKLLSGLKYRPGMTVLCIVSGEHMPSATDVKDKRGNVVQEGKAIDLKAFAQRAKELGLATMAAGAGRSLAVGA